MARATSTVASEGSVPAGAAGNPLLGDVGGAAQSKFGQIGHRLLGEPPRVVPMGRASIHEASRMTDRPRPRCPRAAFDMSS